MAEREIIKTRGETMPADIMTGPLDQLAAETTTCRSFQHSKRRRRTRLKLEVSRDDEKKRMNRSLVMIISHVLIVAVVASQLIRPNQAQEAPPVEPQSQALIYLLNELGSGDGPSGGHSRTPHSSGGLSSSAGPGSQQQQQDVSPSLIEARCWNNYENDNECKQMNVITAPEGERHLPTNHEHSSDAIITPVVIFEASSTLEPEGGEGLDESGYGRVDDDAKFQRQRPTLLAPPYFSSQAPPSTYGGYGQPPVMPTTTTTTTPAGSVMPTARPNREPAPGVTRPSVVHFVATPQPKGAKRPKTTTQGRKCRDENDADCDEPEPSEGDNQTGPSDKSENGGGDDDDDDDGGGNDTTDQDEETNGGNDRAGAPTATGGSGGGGGQSNLIDEQGSGGGYPNGPANDDNDDDDGTDDDATDDGSESSGDSSNEIGDPTSTQRTHLVEVTSIPFSATQVASTGAPPASSQVGDETTSAALATTRRPGGNAQIDVVVHSTLPPNFPQRHNGYNASDSSSSFVRWQDSSSTSEPTTTTTTTTTTMIPEEIYTSKPIFPPTTSTSQPATSLPADDLDKSKQQQQQVTAPSTTENLYTFKPVPIPVGQPEIQASRLDPSAGTQTGQGESPAHLATNEYAVNKKHMFEPPGRRPYERPQASFDDGWTTRKPLPSSLIGQGPVNSPPDALGQLGQANKRNPSRGGHPMGHMGTEMLPTLLLYASIIILLTTALIFLVMGYVFWRRNTLRRQAMLAKAHMMNGALQQQQQQPPPAMIESMSHASHLMQGGGPGGPAAPYQQGLLSTYAPGKGLSMGKVTTSLVKPSDANAMMGQANEDDEDAEQQQQQQRSNSKEQLVADADSLMVDVDHQQQQQQQQQPVTNRPRNPRLAKSPGDPVGQSGSWSTTDDQTNTTTSSGASGSSQQQIVVDQRGAQINAGAANSMTAHPYPNSLSDGHQNSGSLSDSQCSPDPGPSSQPPAPMGHHGHQSQVSNGPGMAMSNSPHHQPQIFYSPPNLNGETNGHMMRPSPHHIAYNPMAIQNGNGLKQRLVTSRSIEDNQVEASHVGFVNEPPPPPRQAATNDLYDPRRPQQHVPYMPNHPSSQPTYQPYQPVVHPSLMHNNNQMMLGSQRAVAMNPLATLGRRYPPNAGLNRNIYSEDSSSFMTTSPSLARTSSSSSFAFNMSNLPTPSSIKANPLAGGGGQAIADYTAGFDQRQPDEASIGRPGAGPPVFGRGDRSDAWYV